ncbi:MAG: PEP-CTERM sorting domain-containing protein [Microcystis novacekii Mn_MB_F_20050700_S1]|uniref:PEP-CTERM sorting domain-containing protein n=1 Tax=Microcystis novacekii Mn_MB_F_20050700_S1D TaxID=2486266 RepID=A0A552IMQ8_9CHRO|nr:MAG: PEP-CTERM sorting domain-containing protein [Microcystis novacekii Mn_MB_F_20050700_S1D]TRU91733.1 MAG: PEP-CTERM sorting domain-containing protein [Microcystis novacekii Mn_MB_F_20050700_S1]
MKIAIASSVLTFSTLAISPVQAAQLIIPNTTVLGTNVFSGPTFTVSGNFLPSDTLSINVSGTVDLAAGGLTINAAGVIVAPQTTVTGNNPGQIFIAGGSDIVPGKPNGALLIGNGTLGFFPLFSATAANGLGNANPPTNLSLSGVPLSSIFTNVGFTGIANGTVLEFRVNDSNTFDNSGQFVISSQQVPEPSKVLGLGMLGLGAVAQRKLARSKESNKQEN